MIDLHFHLLPGIDDGPPTLDDAVALAAAAVAAGTQTIVATPHVNRTYRNDAAAIGASLEAVKARLAEEDLPLEVRGGAELAMTMVGAMRGEQLAELTLDGSRWLLLECPFVPVASGFDLLVAELQGRGHSVLLAHPERSQMFHRDPELLRRLVSDGALVSITAGSLVGRFGGEVKRFSRQLVDAGLVHNVASDAHNLSSRPPGMRLELEEAGLGGLADWLTCEVPEAILAGERLPPPPEHAAAARPGSPWWRRALRRA